MCHKLINRSPDLKKLRDEGYELEIRGAFGLVHHIPYVNANKEIKYGTLVSSLNLSSEKTSLPETHVMYFIGEHPCNRDGSRIQSIVHGSGDIVLDANLGIRINHSFSNKPQGGFSDYYEKFTSYIRVISSQAEVIDNTVKTKTFRPIESKDAESVFHYLDTNSSRAAINVISAKLENLKIAIVGLGGTGSYVLDYVAKTHVLEIHTFDGDWLLQHNAFRAPGAVTLQHLEARIKKVHYYHGVYSQMRKNIFPHDYHVCTTNVAELAGMDFVFLCIDDGESKKAIVNHLISVRIPFVDVGIGVQIVDGAITGSVRATLATPAKHKHIDARISFGDEGKNEYAQNIQIAELNALNAAFAVIKWKKMFGFYHDLEKEHHFAYEINVNSIINDETLT